ncbi:MAG: hypothetical protein ACYDC5_02270 [Candidatus Dormibacteria bacterium]
MRDHYPGLKHQPAVAPSADREAYREGKSEFVQRWTDLVFLADHSDRFL